jgi:rod shape-determining protein MreD
MKPVLYTVAAIILYAVNTVLPQPFGGSVNLLLLFVVCAALADDSSAFLWAAFLSGLLLDASSGLAFGTYTVAFLLVALLIKYATATIFSSEFSPATLVGFVAAAYFFTVAALYAGSVIASRYAAAAPLSPLFVNEKIWLDLAFDLIFAYPMYALTAAIERYVERHDRRRKALL